MRDNGHASGTIEQSFCRHFPSGIGDGKRELRWTKHRERTPPPVVSVIITPSSNQSVVLGNTMQFSASVSGSSNTAVTWAVNGASGGSTALGTISNSGLYTAPADLPTPATVTIAATSQADTTKAASTSVTITSDITVTIQSNPSGSEVLTGSTLQLTASVNSAGKPDTNVTWSVNGMPNGNSTFGTITSTGTDTATYTAPTNLPLSAAFPIQATSVADTSKFGQLAVTIVGITLAISPNHATVQTGATQQFGATIICPPGLVCAAVLPTLTWSVNNIQGGNATVGTISATGLYTAPATVPNSNPVTVSAAVTGNPSESGAAMVTITAPSVAVSVSPTSATIRTGATQQFTATVTGTSNTTVNWSVDGAAGGNTTVGTISASGLYTAPAAAPSPNTVTIAATTVADPSESDSATVTITALVTVSVSPTSGTIQPGATVQFTATVTGTTNTAVTWSVNGIQGGNSTLGTVSPGGLYTAPSAVPSPSTVTVTATSVADTTKSASATVTITAGGTVVASATIGPSGGTVEVNDPTSPLFGVKVAIPATALSQSTLITIGTVPAPLMETGLETRGPNAELGPSGLTFNVPVAITFPSISTDLSTNSELIYFQNGNQLQAFYNNSEAEGPTQTVDVTNNLITAYSYHFTPTGNYVNTDIEADVNNGLAIGFDDSLTSYPGNCICPLRPATNITQLVIHSTHTPLGSRFPAILNGTLTLPAFAHYYVDRSNGAVIQRFDDLDTAPHVRNLADGTNVNASAIGIEMHSNLDQEGSSTPFSSPEIESTLKLAAKLMKEYRIPPSGIFNHAYYAPMALCPPIPDHYTSCQAYINDHLDPFGLDFSTFTSRLLTLTVTKSGGGTGSVQCPNVEGIPSFLPAPSPSDCSGTISVPSSPGPSSFTAWSQVCPGAGAPCNIPLTATPDDGFIFAGWSGAYSGTGACNVLMSQVQTVSADFELASTYSGNFNAPFIGTASDPDGDTYSASASGALTLNIVQNADGTISGSASVPTNMDISVVSCPDVDCTASSFSITASGPVSGNVGSLGGTFVSSNQHFTFTFTGSLSGNTITGSATFSQVFVGTSTDSSSSVSTTLSGSIPSITLSKQ